MNLLKREFAIKFVLLLIETGIRNHNQRCPPVRSLPLRSALHTAVRRQLRQPATTFCETSVPSLHPQINGFLAPASRKDHGRKQHALRARQHEVGVAMRHESSWRRRPGSSCMFKSRPKFSEKGFAVLFARRLLQSSARPRSCGARR